MRRKGKKFNAAAYNNCVCAGEYTVVSIVADVGRSAVNTGYDDEVIWI
jgi:hypothetical protein